MPKTEELDEHEKFKEWCALAQCKALSRRDQLALNRHLEVCDSCRSVYQEYSAISEQGMPFLLADDDLMAEASQWDGRSARQFVMDSIYGPRPNRIRVMKPDPLRQRSLQAIGISGRALVFASLAACAIFTVALGAYRAGERKSFIALQPPAAVSAKKEALEVHGITSGSPVVVAHAAQTSSLEEQYSSAREELAQLRQAFNAAQRRVDELEAANGQKDALFRQLTDQRDQLASRLVDSEKAYEVLKSEYSNFRAEHDRNLLNTAALESELKELSTANQEQERRLKDDEQYLNADRDIRELMGARKLYIADVFDVDSESHTRKPFGRVFYTQDKSLVFYAYDLDHQPGVQNASVFQVWGQRDAETNGTSKAMNLGILYMDSESNRRWVLRSDDPKQLSEIDAVFVTVEPHGGSQKPTGKPLLYALLRKEANHP